MRPVGASDRQIARTRQSLLCRARNHHEDALHIVRQNGRARRDILPRLILYPIGAEPGASARQHPTELAEVRDCRTEALYSAADHELLIQDADSTVRRVRFGEDGTQIALHSLTSVHQLLGTK